MLWDYIDRRVLEELCKDSRVKIKSVAASAGCTPQTASKRIKHLEELGLKYSIELETQRLGYTTEYFVRVRFKSGRVNEEEIKSVLEKCPYVQFACFTKGSFDLFIWAIAPDRDTYEKEMEAEIRVALDDYILDWHSHGLLLKRGGFMPINNDIIDLIQIPRNEKETLKILNQNSRLSLQKISQKFEISKSAVIYRINKASNYIRRFTAFFPAPTNLLYAIRFFQVCGKTKTFASYAPQVNNLYLHSSQKADLFNKTIYSTVVDGGMDNFFIEAFSSKKSFEEHNQALENLSDIIIRKQEYALVTKIIKGVVPIRAIDLRKEIPYLLSPVEINGKP